MMCTPRRRNPSRNEGKTRGRKKEFRYISDVMCSSLSMKNDTQARTRIRFGSKLVTGVRDAPNINNRNATSEAKEFDAPSNALLVRSPATVTIADSGKTHHQALRTAFAPKLDVEVIFGHMPLAALHIFA